MKKYIVFLLLFSSLFLFGCEKSQIANTSTQRQLSGGTLPTQTINGIPSSVFEGFIEQSVNCKNGEDSKVFISYSILGTGISKNGNMIYYLIAAGSEYYLDKRGNINQGCASGGTPLKFEIAYTKDNNSYTVVDSGQSANIQGLSPTLEEVFPPSIVKKIKNKSFEKHPQDELLRKAEKYFGVDVFTGKSFVCDFCDRKWYYSSFYDIFEEGSQIGVEVFGREKTEQSKRDDVYIYTSFSSSGIYESHMWGTGKWMFGKDKNTILIQQSGTIPIIRLIILKQSSDQIEYITEIIQ